MNDKELKILKTLAKAPATARELQQTTEIARSTLYYLLKRLRKHGLINYEESTQKYKITVDGLNTITLAEKTGIWRIHNIKVVLLVKKTIDLNKLKEMSVKEVNMKNWTAYYIDLKDDGIDANVQLNIADNISAIVHLNEFETTSLQKALLIIQNKIEEVRKILKLRGILTYSQWVDTYFDRKLIRAEYAIPAKNAVDPGVRISLGEQAKSLDGKKFNEEAEIWTDESKGETELETNDSETARILEYLVKQAPQDIAYTKKSIEETTEFISEIRQVIKEMANANKLLAENERTHIGYAKEMLEASKAFKEGANEFNKLLMKIESKNRYENIAIYLIIIMLLIVILIKTI